MRPITGLQAQGCRADVTAVTEHLTLVARRVAEVQGAAKQLDSTCCSAWLPSSP